MRPPMIGLADNGDFGRMIRWGALNHVEGERDDIYFNWVNREYKFVANPTTTRGLWLSSEVVFVKIAAAIGYWFVSDQLFDLRILGLIHILGRDSGVARPRVRPSTGIRREFREGVRGKTGRAIAPLELVGAFQKVLFAEVSVVLRSLSDCDRHADFCGLAKERRRRSKAGLGVLFRALDDYPDYIGHPAARRRLQ